MWGMLDRYTDKGGIDTWFNRQTKDILIRLDSVFNNIYEFERKHTHTKLNIQLTQVALMNG